MHAPLHTRHHTPSNVVSESNSGSKGQFRACDALGVAPSYGDFVAVRNAFLGGGLTAALLETRVPGRAEELMADDERRPASCWTAAALRWRGLAALVKFTFVP